MASVKPIHRAVLLTVSMVFASALGFMVSPTTEGRRAGPAFELASIVPSQFGDWTQESGAATQVVNPQTQALLDRLYSQILTRNYVSAGGYRMMLSIAYGDDQRGGLEAHRPEVCYPAQGFSLKSSESSSLTTPYGSIDARRLDTQLGPRKEPVTYWLTVGGKSIRNRLDKRWVEFRLTLTGQVPDGLLFRVSSIDSDKERAFREHEAFVTSLLSAVSTTDRIRLSGLGDAEHQGNP